MDAPRVHVGRARSATEITSGFSLEITAKDGPALRAAASDIAEGTPVAVTFLAGETFATRLALAREVRELGLEPVPHLAARRIGSTAELEGFMAAAVADAGVRQCFLVAGDAAQPEGPFVDSMALLASGVFERLRIATVGIGGHPEGHGHMSDEQCWRVLAHKCAEIQRRGMAPLIVTQFAFDADRVLDWVAELRRRGINAPVRLGVPGPAGIKTLIRFAARCGVGASTSVLAKYGISIGNLLGAAGPDRLVEALAARLGPEHGAVSLHFYPFGGVEKTVAWIEDYRRSLR